MKSALPRLVGGLDGVLGGLLGKGAGGGLGPGGDIHTWGGSNSQETDNPDERVPRNRRHGSSYDRESVETDKSVIVHNCPRVAVMISPCDDYAGHRVRTLISTLSCNGSPRRGDTSRKIHYGSVTWTVPGPPTAFTNLLTVP